MKYYGYVARWVDAVGAPVVPGLERLEKINPKLTPDRLRFLWGLLTPQARQATAPALASANVSMQSLEAAAVRAKREMWLGWHWADTTPLIDADRLQDPLMREQFDRAITDTSHLTTHVGGWTWSEDTPQPPWSTLSRAAVWTDDRYAGLRANLRRSRTQYSISPQSDGVLTLSAIG